MTDPESNEDLFHAALALGSGDARALYLRRVCGLSITHIFGSQHGNRVVRTQSEQAFVGKIGAQRFCRLPAGSRMNAGFPLGE